MHARPGDWLADDHVSTVFPGLTADELTAADDERDQKRLETLRLLRRAAGGGHRVGA